MEVAELGLEPGNWAPESMLSNSTPHCTSLAIPLPTGQWVESKSRTWLGRGED